MNEKKKNKFGCGCLIPIVILMFIVGFGIIRTNVNFTPTDNSKSVLAKELSLNSNQEAAMKTIFTECGIGEITEAKKFQSGEGHTSYYLEDKETEFYEGANGAIIVWVTDSSKTIESIHFNDNDVYAEGKIISPITDFYVNETDRNKYRNITQEAIKKVLNYPDTAKFHGISAWQFTIEDGLAVARSTVEAKNAFGMESKEVFQAKFDNGKLTSLIVDGTEYIKQ
ncbi:MAG: hypothetical protein IJ192_00940 [Clostridia bacterium]|nr:hypothetical protein [Clostridia bacterium]